jgi:hypothetical protein
MDSANNGANNMDKAAYNDAIRVKRADVEQLYRAAVSVGDSRMQRLCVAALEGDLQAWRAVANLIEDLNDLGVL